MLRAHYDKFGNIILRSIVRDVQTQVDAEPENTTPAYEVWTHIDDDTPSEILPPAIDVSSLQQPVHSVIKNTCAHAKDILRATLEEGSKQLEMTTNDAGHIVEHARAALSNVPKKTIKKLQSLWHMAQTPVTLPGRKAGRRPRKKMTLFLIDTVRFGGTFGLIFGVLFIGMNYQSFWQIARAELALGTDIRTEQALTSITEKSTSTTTVQGMQMSGNINMLAYLPPVGPHDDRLIIPKLGINVPIVRPSMDALLAENWPQFETDIQTALRDGVVHYPGSARPGQAGNVFVTGHSSYYPTDKGRFKSIFARLGELDLGDSYTMYYGGDRHTYRIVKKYEVKPNNVSVLDQPTTQRLSTLMTCTPIGTTLRRLIVQAEEIDPESGEILAVGERRADTPKNHFTRLGALPI